MPCCHDIFYTSRRGQSGVAHKSLHQTSCRCVKHLWNTQHKMCFEVCPSTQHSMIDACSDVKISYLAVYFLVSVPVHIRQGPPLFFVHMVSCGGMEHQREAHADRHQLGWNLWDKLPESERVPLNRSKCHFLAKRQPLGTVRRIAQSKLDTTNSVLPDSSRHFRGGPEKGAPEEVWRAVPLTRLELPKRKPASTWPPQSLAALLG